MYKFDLIDLIYITDTDIPNFLSFNPDICKFYEKDVFSDICKLITYL